MTPGVPLRAVTLDYWDTLYDGANLADRLRLRRDAVGALLQAYGREASVDELEALYIDAGREFDQRWREEQGYTTGERLRWTLERAGLEPKEGCAHVTACARAVDDALLAYPPPLLPGAADAVRRLAARYRLAIISDTGFASGEGQDRLLARDGLLECFPARIYSCDVGVPKPRREMFDAALSALGVRAAETLHVGDIERTDVAGALAMGMRAVRTDQMRDSGVTQAERVVTSLLELADYLEGQ